MSYRVTHECAVGEGLRLHQLVSAGGAWTLECSNEYCNEENVRYCPMCGDILPLVVPCTEAKR